jgi:hypothetical protein
MSAGRSASSYHQGQHCNRWSSAIEEPTSKETKIKGNLVALLERSPHERQEQLERQSAEVVTPVVMTPVVMTPVMLTPVVMKPVMETLKALYRT